MDDGWGAFLLLKHVLFGKTQKKKNRAGKLNAAAGEAEKTLRKLLAEEKKEGIRKVLLESAQKKATLLLQSRSGARGLSVYFWREFLETSLGKICHSETSFRKIYHSEIYTRQLASMERVLTAMVQQPYAQDRNQGGFYTK